MTTMRKITIAVAIPAVLCLAASAASGEVMTYNGMGLREIVNVHAPSVNLRAYAGQMKIEYEGIQYNSYCVDIYQHAATADDFEPLPIDTLNNGELVAYLHQTYGQVTNATQAAALQVAIWELINEPAANGLDVSRGDFRVNGNNDVTDAASVMLESLAVAEAPRYQYYVLHSDTKQDMLMPTSTPVPVPEPASIAILAAGAGLNLLRRKRLGRLAQAKLVSWL